jgi:hypothetical protein
VSSQDRDIEGDPRVSGQDRQTSRVPEAANVKKKSQPGIFNIGTRGTGRVELKMKGGMKEAKRMLEDKIRKEKREQKLAEIRKPLPVEPYGSLSKNATKMAIFSA